MTNNKQFILISIFMIFLVFGERGGLGVSQAAEENRNKQTLTVCLKELNAKYGERISFSPTITDKIYPSKLVMTGTLDEVLEKLLLGTDLGFKAINEHYYIYVKVKETPPAVVLPKAEPEKSPELDRETPLPIVSAPYPAMLTVQAITPIRKFRYPIVKSLRYRESPVFALKTNLLYDATATVNLGVEFALAAKWSMDVSGNYNAWVFSDNLKWKHAMVQPELRYWLCERFNGHFVGTHLHAGAFNVGALPSLGGLVSDNMRQYRYEGYFYGGGFTYGYSWILNNRWSLEAVMGLGYARINYDKYPCGDCGVKIKNDAKIILALLRSLFHWFSI